MIRRSRLRWIACVLTLVLVGAGSVALAYPAAAAIACPACYGFDRLSGDIYVESSSSPDARASITRVMAEAHDRVRSFYGRLESRPNVLICLSDACYRRVGGGGSRGMAVLDRALFLSARGITPVIASHELSHIELHHRIGLIGTMERRIPQWFDEGLAVTISDDPRYLAPATSADRCLMRSNEDLPTARQAWVERAESNDLYAKAACRVSRWLADRGGSKAVIALSDKIARGQSFDAVYP